MLAKEDARAIINSHSIEAVDAAREYRLQCSNMSFLELDVDNNLVPIENPPELDRLKEAYRTFGYEDGVFTKDDYEAFDNILAALEVVEPDPSIYKLTTDHWQTAIVDLDSFKLSELCRA